MNGRFLARLYSTPDKTDRNSLDFQFIEQNHMIRKQDITHIGSKRPLEPKTVEIIMDELMIALKNYGNRCQDVMESKSRVEIYAWFEHEDV